MTLTELAEAASLPPSTVHRLLTTLEAERFVRSDPQGGNWRIGVTAFTVGTAFTRSRDLLTICRPYLRRLMEITGETANLFVESREHVVCIGQIESRHAMRAITGVGGQVQMHASAAGKAILAHSEAFRGSESSGADELEKVTDRTITDPTTLAAALADVRQRGYATDDEEHAPGLRCVAAPVFNELAETVGAISISGPVSRIPDSRLGQLGKAVSQGAAEATAEFGGRMPEQG